MTDNLPDVTGFLNELEESHVPRKRKNVPVEFSLKSGTDVIIDDKGIEIIRTNGKSAFKALALGRTMGNTYMKISSVSGAVVFADYLMIFASGFSSPNDFKISNIGDVKEFPNCIVGKKNELIPIYEEIIKRIK